MFSAKAKEVEVATSFTSDSPLPPYGCVPWDT